jgi:hypothetical protein
VSQFIYAIAALAAVILFAVNTRHAGVSVEQDTYLTEAHTRMLGVAKQSLEQISRMELPFDAMTNADLRNQYEVFPYVDSPAELTSAGAFGGCNEIGPSCMDLDDFHGINLKNLDAGGLPYDLEISVAYVDTVDGSPSMSQTFAKEITATVSTGAVLVAGDSVSVSYSRVFAYPSVFEYAVGAESLLNLDIYH